MADWTANSSFGAFDARREPTFRTTREPAAPRAEGPRAERFAAQRPSEEAPASAGAALAQYNASLEGPLAKARLLVWAGGGVVSLALIAGIGVWGYKLVLREVLGLPVVVAEEGPMRVLPADPGGEVVPQQGLAVNAIPAAGTAAPPSDVLLLAPPPPGLAEEDMEVIQTRAEADELMPAAAPAPAEAAAELAPAPEAAPAAAPIASDPAAQAAAQLLTAILPSDRPMSTEEILAFADQIAAQAAPPAAPAPAPAETAAVETAAVETAAVAAAPLAAAPLATAPLPAAPAAEAPLAAPAEATAAPVPAAVAGLAAAIRPLARPAAVPAAAPAAPVAAEATAAPAEAAPAAASGPTLTASLPSGTNLIQLGAFDSPEIAASEWDRLQGAFGEFLGSKERVIQETQSGGRTLYRLRALGFADRADARRLCAALTAEGADCIPVTVD